jgi:hypothetical protein
VLYLLAPGQNYEVVNAAGCKLVMTNHRPRFKRALTWVVVIAVQAVLVAMVVNLGSLRPAPSQTAHCVSKPTAATSLRCSASARRREAA